MSNLINLVTNSGFLISLTITTTIGIILVAWIRRNKQSPPVSFKIENSNNPQKMKSGGGKKTKTKPKLLIAAFALMFVATITMAFVLVQAQTENQYNTKPWFVTVYELDSTLKGHLMQTTVNFENWRYTQATILVKNEGEEAQTCSITVLLQNKNNATIAYGDLTDTGLVQPDQTSEFDIDLTWTGNSTISDSRTWFIGTTPHATAP